MTLQELATLVGSWAATERRLFELSGSWVRLVEEPARKVMLAAHSRHHGWRATVFDGVTPSATGVVPGATVAPQVAELRGPEDLERLYDTVLPSLASEYEAFAAGAGPAEAAVARWARLVAADVRFDVTSRR